MISLMKNEIDGVTVELTVEETIGSQLGGYPMIMFGDINIQSTMVAEVDTLAVIKAIATSKTVGEFSRATEDCYNHNNMVIMLKSFALYEIKDNFAQCQYNELISEEIEELELFLRDDSILPRSKMLIESRLFDLKSKMIVKGD